MTNFLADWMALAEQQLVDLRADLDARPDLAGSPWFTDIQGEIALTETSLRRFRERDSSTPAIKPIECSHHRNGISGVPFNVHLFLSEGRLMLGIVFDDSPGCCAVFDLAKLSESDIRFGHNSFRGDTFEKALRQLCD